ncbi:MAG TPA: formyltransferase family protein [Candidatus Paceibacterota bacterium]|nr:formyltransferase family protein [Candidatus Paceibacterota bacterium]
MQQNIQKNRKKLLVFASGGKEPNEGGSGFQEMVEFSRTDPPILDADIVAVISNNQFGGVYNKSQLLNIPFEYWSGPFDEEGYKTIIEKYQPDFVMLSGWLKKTIGLNPSKTINIHPGPLPEFGGKGMYGHFVHEAVIEAFHQGKIKQSAISMHFVTEKYDEGPIIVKYPVLIRLDDTPQTLAQRVNEKERVIQSIFLNLVVMGYITYPDPDYRMLVIDEKIWGFYKQFANIPGQKYEIKK